MFKRLRLSTKITSNVSFILVILLLSSVAGYIYHETHKFEEDINKTALQVMSVLESIHTQAMLNWGGEKDNNPVIETLKGTFDQLSETAHEMTLWLVMGPKVLTYREKDSFRKIAPPRDDIDREAIETGLSVARMVGDDIFRLTRPVILGRGVASDKKCFGCHGNDMGIKKGEVIGAYSIALDVTHRRSEFVVSAWAHALIAILISVTISAVSVFFLNRLAVVPIARMTGIMGRLARGDLEVEVPDRNSDDEIGEMALAIKVFKENAIERKRAEEALAEANEKLELRVAQRTSELAGINESLAREIVERKRAEEELRRHQQELAHVQRLSTMGEMAAGLAHEINEPLSAITNYAQGCVRRLRGGKGETSELLEAMERVVGQAERAAEFINRIRGFTKKWEPKKTRVDINVVIRDVAHLLKAETHRHGATIELELADSLPPMIVDTIQIQQIILNLGRNALEAMGDGASNSHRLTIRTSMREDKAIEVAVKDTGHGIAPESLEKVFEPFFTTRNGGLGLGLSICRSIVENHGGRLWASTEDGRGAVFRFTLPTAERDGHVVA